MEAIMNKRPLCDDDDMGESTRGVTALLVGLGLVYAAITVALLWQ